jgi:hypothetical protein
LQAKDNKGNGGEGGIRTLGTGVSPYNGLANRRIRPLCHLSKQFVINKLLCNQQAKALPYCTMPFWTHATTRPDRTRL